MTIHRITAPDNLTAQNLKAQNLCNPNSQNLISISESHAPPTVSLKLCAGCAQWQLSSSEQQAQRTHRCEKVCNHVPEQAQGKVCKKGCNHVPEQAQGNRSMRKGHTQVK